MTVTVLGSGPSGGVPLIGCSCAVCTSNDSKNRRLRPSILVEQGGTRLLVDTSPDLRQQALRANIKGVDAILYTHAHADHCHGIDDARSFNFHSNKPVEVYGTQETLDEIRHRFGYAFGALGAPKAVYKPALRANVIGEYDRFTIGAISVESFLQLHGKGKSCGYRIGNFAYSTDVNNLPEQSLQLLEKLDVWLVDCLQYEAAPTHAHLAMTLEWIEKLKPRQAILTHMTHAIDYAELAGRLPAHVTPAYDGMRFNIPA